MNKLDHIEDAEVTAEKSPLKMRLPRSLSIILQMSKIDSLRQEPNSHRVIGNEPQCLVILSRIFRGEGSMQSEG
jgi:hypothetical protein